MRVNREALIHLRRMGGDSQGTLAARTRPSVSEEAIRLIEVGTTLRPHPRTLKALAEALSVPIGAITYPDEPSAVAS